jgi:hypothetical protein
MQIEDIHRLQNIKDKQNKINTEQQVNETHGSVIRQLRQMTVSKTEAVLHKLLKIKNYIKRL